MSNTKIESSFADGLEADLGETIDEAVGAEADGMRSNNPKLGSASMPVTGDPFPFDRKRVAQRSDLDALMTTGATILELQRAKLSATQSEYEMARTAAADSYRKKLDALQHEGEEALRAIDQRFRTEMAECERTIDVVLAMRKANDQH